MNFMPSCNLFLPSCNCLYAIWSLLNRVSYVPDVPAWYTCPCAHVPKAFQIFNLACQCANINFICQKARQFFNYFSKTSCFLIYLIYSCLIYFVYFAYFKYKPNIYFYMNIYIYIYIYIYILPNL